MPNDPMTDERAAIKERCEAIKACGKSWDQAHEAYCKLAAKNGRLVSERDRLKKLLSEADASFERLWKTNAELRGQRNELEAERERLTAEVERLKVLLDSPVL